MKAARLVACLCLGIAALNAAHVAAQQTNGTSSGPPSVTDPLAKELVRCKALHEQAANDARCQAAYKESRARFLTPPSAYQPPPAHIDADVPEPKLIKPDQPQSK